MTNLSLSKRVGLLLSALLASAALLAPVLSTNAADRQFSDFVYAPPMRPHVRDHAGRWRRPFIYPLRLVNRLERRFEEEARPVPLRWFTNSRLVSVDPSDGPWLPLGGDAVGRDVYSRLMSGARLSLGVALLATAGSLALGSLIGAIAGFSGGRLERAADVAGRLGHRSTCYVCRACPEGRHAAGLDDGAGLLGDDGHPGGCGLAVRGPRRAGNRGRRESEGVRRICARSGRERVANFATPFAAGRQRVSAGASGVARASLRPGGSHAFVRWPGILRTCGQLGRHAARRRTGPGVRRCALAAGARCRHRTDHVRFTAARGHTPPAAS